MRIVGWPVTAETRTESWLRSGLSRLQPARPSLWPTLRPLRLPTDRKSAAVLVPIVLAQQPFVLLTRRSALLRHHAGQVSFPGGRPDGSDADAVDTALREAAEEIGLDPTLVEIMGRLPDFDTGTSRFTIVPIVALLSPHATWSASADEVAAIFGLPLDTLIDPDAPRLSRSGPRAGTWSWPHPEHDIWGATAGILVTLARLLQGPPGARRDRTLPP
ncbi:CoA pyrophosphatase [Lichenicola sp.]|uniref:CoA pyrophosphatase n=1 Tax=Lichenicola sp. TaxID=2804529 RepID=UPI003B00384B